MESLMGYALCAGIVYLVWKWRKKKKGSLSESNPKSNNDSHYAMPIATDDGAEQRISSLHREATELKSNGDLDRAIQCLREAENLKKNVRTIYPIKHSLRLPLFLQQSGKFDEAMVEFQRLLDGTEKRVLAWLPKRNIGSKKMLMEADLYQIYGSMVTACKREKRQDLVEEYSELYEKHKNCHAKLLKQDMARGARKN